MTAQPPSLPAGWRWELYEPDWYKGHFYWRIYDENGDKIAEPDYYTERPFGLYFQLWGWYLLKQRASRETRRRARITEARQQAAEFRRKSRGSR